MPEIRDFASEYIRLAYFLQILKTSWFTPTLPEFMLFVLIFVLFMIFLLISQSTAVKNRVAKTSLCYKRNNAKIIENADTQITALNTKGTPLYNVNYNLADKKYSISCACPVGEVVNKFENIKVYDMETQSQNLATQFCNCNSMYDDTENIGPTSRDTYNLHPEYSYVGDPAIVRYTTSDDTSVFRNMLS